MSRATSSKATRHRRSQSRVRRFARSAVARSAPPGGHSSKAMTTSAPSCRWTRITDSGVNMCRLPSRWLWNSTPSSRISLISPRLKTWNPPESVSSGFGQRMKSWRPPNSWTSSAPGRRKRWYVLASTIVAPIVSSSAGSSPFTVARVPTGMNVGVCTAPCGVSKVPQRAAPSVACSSNAKSLTTRSGPGESAWRHRTNRSDTLRRRRRRRPPSSDRTRPPSRPASSGSNGEGGSS